MPKRAGCGAVLWRWREGRIQGDAPYSQLEGIRATYLAMPRSRERPQKAVLSVHHRAESTRRILASAAQAMCSQG